MKTISVHVSEKAYSELKSVAARCGRPVAELIRQAMERYLEDERSNRPSILDIAPHPSGPLLSSWTRSAIYDEMFHP